MKIRSLKTVLVCFFLLTGKLFGQPLFFEKTFGTAANDQSLSVKQLSDGSIYIAGSSDSIIPGDFDATLSKLHKFGNLLWIKYYNGGRNDFAFQLIVLPDNSLVLAGSRQQASGFYDALAIRIDTSGAILYQNTFGDALQDESFSFLSKDGYGKLIACGYATTAAAYNDVYVVRLDLNCNQIWENRYGGSDIEYGQRIIPACDSGYVFVADTKSFGSGTYDLWLSKLDTLGNVEWNYVSVDTLENGSQGVICTQDGNFLMFGETEIAAGSPFDFLMEKVSANGSSLWKKNFGDPLYKDALFEMIELSADNFICTGYSNTFNHGLPLDLIVFQTDSTGNIGWANSYGGPYIDIGYDMIPSYNGGYLVTGKTSALTNDEYYLLSLDSLGLLTSFPDLRRGNPCISIYPNPSEGIFDVTARETGKEFTIEIYNLSGQLIYNDSSISSYGSLHVDLGAYISAGCYILKVNRDGKNDSALLIIQ